MAVTADPLRLHKEWPAVQEGWKEWVAPLNDHDVEARIPYRDLKGNPWEQPLW